MALFPWDESLAVHVRELDWQHRKLVDMINDLHEAMRAGSSQKTTGDMVGRLKSYCKEHFSAEERLMERHQYPDLQTHRAEHNRFIEQVLDMEMEISEGQQVSGVRLMGFLRDWLSNHIKGVDHKYGPYLHERGVR